MPTLGILTLLFFLSGAAGLMYESIWARYLGLFVGHDAYGQIAVLVIFLGGMSLGAAAVSRVTTRLRSPLLGYAVVELVAGAIGLAFHAAFLRITGQAHETIYPALAGSPWLTAIKWALAGGLILPQSVLLGATFPLMAAGAIRLTRLPEGRVLAQLYFSNSLGAAVGVLVAGFYLVGRFGLPGTLQTAALLNLLVGLAAAAVARAPGRTPAPASEPPLAVPDAARPRAGAGLRRLLLGVTFGTAVASFIYEVGWIRMLSLVLGSATHSFELMLSAFILGLALGARWIRSRADRLADPLAALGWIQWLMGLCAVATLPVYVASFTWMTTLLDTFARTEGGYAWFTIARYGLCLAVMFPATFLAGMTLPLITRTLMDRGEGEQAVGAVYAVNTLGSIAGVILAGVALLPWIGLKPMLVTGAVVDMGLGVLLFRSAGQSGRRVAGALVAATVAVAAAAASLAPLQRGLLTSGVFRRGYRPVPERSVMFYRDGRTATVSAVRMPDLSLTYLATNGKPDASLPREWFVPCRDTPSRQPLTGDAGTQTLIALIALAHAPGARSAAVIGHGSGLSSHHLLASPRLERLVTLEIEPQMIAGSRVFYPLNRKVFDDRRSTLVIEDAKTYFAAQQASYDLILSEPSNPWVSGVAGLFSQEFYARIRRHLAPNGVFAQWLQLYESNDDLALGVLAAVHRSFPSYEIFFTTDANVLIVAGMEERLVAPDWSVLSWPEVERDLCRSVPITPAAMEASRLAGRGLLGPLVDSLVTPNSDFHPVLDVGAEKARYFGSTALGLQELARHRFSLAGLLEERRQGLPEDPRLPVASLPRQSANSVSAQVRADRGGAGPGHERSQMADASEAIYEWRLWQSGLQSESGPNSWEVWVRRFEEMERIVNGGAVGVADEQFYASARRYLDRHDAPAPVRAVVDFYHGLAAWDWPRTAYAADRLLPELRRGTSWISPDELRDGAVVARLKLGDPERARVLYRQLAPLSARPPGDLQTRLLEAHIRRAEAALRTRVLRPSGGP